MLGRNTTDDLFTEHVCLEVADVGGGQVGDELEHRAVGGILFGSGQGVGKHVGVRGCV